VRHVDPQRHRVLFGIGIGLIVANIPVGWVGGLGFAAVAAVTKDHRWALLAIGTYLASWAVMGVGVLIAGKAGLERARHIMYRRRRLKELLHLRRQRRDARRAVAEAEPPP